MIKNHIVHLLNFSTTFRSCLGNHGEITDGHIFTMQQRLFQKLLCILRKKICAKGELLQIRQGSVCDIKKSNVTEVTICVHTIKSCN